MHAQDNGAPRGASLPSGCTFDAHDWHLMARCWFPVLEISRLGNAPVACRLLDQPLVVYRAGGEVVIAADRCPHRGMALSKGVPDPEGLRCAYHGLRFGPRGQCTDVPSVPGCPIGSRFNLTTFPVIERYGLFWTCLDPQPEQTPDLPLMPAWDDPAFQATVCPRYDLDCFAGRQMEGFLDVAHFPWVHNTTFADASMHAVADYSVHPCRNGFTSAYRSPISNYPLESGLRSPPGFLWTRSFHVHLPFSARLTIDFPDDQQLIILNLASPVSANRTHMFVPVARRFDPPVSDEHIHAFNLRVFGEDKPFMEGQRPRRLPLDPREEAHFPADRNGLAYRRALRAQGYLRFFDD